MLCHVWLEVRSDYTNSTYYNELVSTVIIPYYVILAGVSALPYFGD